MTIALSFVDYGFTYSTAERPAVAGVTLAIPAGRVVAVIAAQGGGKTTLLRAAAALLGEIYQGNASGAMRIGSTGRVAAFFDGYVQITLAVETVREELALPLYADGMDDGDRDERVELIARELRIEQLLDRRVTALSGGEEKLVGIAAALVPDAAIHVLDEPFEQLDVGHFSAVIRAAKRRAAAGRLVLVATGSIDTAINVADSAVLFDGHTWRLLDRPTYADVEGVPGLGASAAAEFLERHRADASGVRRYRDAVVKVS